MLAATTYIAAVEAYNASHPGTPIDLTGVKKEDFGRDSAIYRQHLAFQIEGKIRINDTVRDLVLYDK